MRSCLLFDAQLFGAVVEDVPFEEREHELQSLGKAIGPGDQCIALKRSRP